MFAFAIWDRLEHRLHLVRDRIGEKPLYYGWARDTFLFGSELKALRAHPDWRGEIDRDALALYVRFGFVPAPYSIYRSVRKLLPGTILTIEPGRGHELQPPVSYWSAASIAAAAIEKPFTGSEDDAVEELERLLKVSVRDQMIADVPLGAF